MNEPSASLAELSKSKKYALYEDITLENRANFHNISCFPISHVAEDDMELVSDIVSWGELYLHHWQSGSYHCSRCDRALYNSSDKWIGPCVWPSFRKAHSEDAIYTRVVYPYNSYTCVVKEVYCGGCRLFVGHQFEDGREKGDSHPDAQWRH